MKSFILTLIALISLQIIQAQAYPVYGEQNEFKFNAGLFLATTAIDLSYEHFVNEDVSVGGSLYFDNSPEDFNGNFGIGPNLRAYFGYIPRSGFFAEAFGLYYTGTYENTGPDPIRGDYNNFALGLGGGNKWVTRSQKFSLEVFGGIGRTVQPNAYDPDFIYRFGLNLGFRF